MKKVFCTYSIILYMFGMGELLANEYTENRGSSVVIKQVNDSPATVETESYGYNKDGTEFYSKKKGIIDKDGKYKEISSTNVPDINKNTPKLESDMRDRILLKDPACDFNANIRKKVGHRSKIPTLFGKKEDNDNFKKYKKYLKQLKKNPELLINNEFRIPYELEKDLYELNPQNRKYFLKKLRKIMSKHQSLHQDMEKYPYSKHLMGKMFDSTESIFNEDSMELMEKYFKLMYKISDDPEILKAILFWKTNNNPSDDILKKLSLNKQQQKRLKKYFHLMDKIHHDPLIIGVMRKPFYHRRPFVKSNNFEADKAFVDSSVPKKANENIPNKQTLMQKLKHIFNKSNQKANVNLDSSFNDKIIRGYPVDIHLPYDGFFE